MAIAIRSRLNHFERENRSAPGRRARGSSSSSPLRTSGPSSSLTFLIRVSKLNGLPNLPQCRIRHAGRSSQLKFNKRPREMISHPLLIPGKRLVISRMTRIVPQTAGKACPRDHKEIKPDKHQNNIFHQSQDSEAAPPFRLSFYLLMFQKSPCFRLTTRRGRVRSVRGLRRRVGLAQPAVARSVRPRRVRLFSVSTIRILLYVR